MPNLALNDIDLFYEVQGEGVPLLLIAGLASDSQSWQPVIEELSQHVLLITPDNRGTGRTQPQDIVTSIQHIANDCIALIQHLGHSSVHLLGHSMGGFVALDLAIRYPDNVNKLMLAATAATNSKCNNSLFSNWVSHIEAGIDLSLWFMDIFHWLFSVKYFENQTIVNDAIRYAIEYPYPQSSIAFKNQVEAVANYDCTERLSGITAETLVISGKEDLLYPPDVCYQLAQTIPDTAFSIIEGAAHSIHMEQPSIFTSVILEFLSRA